MLLIASPAVGGVNVLQNPGFESGDLARARALSRRFPVDQFGAPTNYIEYLFGD